MTKISVSATFPQRTVFFWGNSYLNYDYVAGNLAYGFRLASTCYNTIISTKKCAMQAYAVGGKETAQMISEFSTVLQPYLKPNDVVLFMEIANDLGVVNAAQAYTNVQTCASLVRSMGAKIIVSSTLPSTGPNEAAKLTVDANIRNNYSSFSDGFFDCRAITHFQTVADCANGTYYNLTDGTHLQRLGYDTLGIALAPQITPFL